MILNLISILLWLPAIALRLILVLLGLVFVPISMIGDGKYRTPSIWHTWASAEDIPSAWTKNIWTRFWWMAIRNPTAGANKWFTQPIAEPRPNPDNLVYSGVQKSAHRWLRHKLFSEYWYLRAVGKKKFELRLGWKFADGTPGFNPTIQLRLGD